MTSFADFSQAATQALGSFSFVDHMVDLSLIGGSFVFALILSKLYRGIATKKLEALEIKTGFMARLIGLKKRLSYPIALVCLFFLSSVSIWTVGYESYLVDLLTKLALAFLGIRFLTEFIESQLFSRIVAWVIWGLVALKLTNLWEPTQQSLDQFSFNIGDSTTSVWLIIQGISILLILIWASGQIIRIFDYWVERVNEFSPSHRVLAQKFFRVVIVVSVLVFGLSSIGIKMQTLAIFSGAIGVGLGFGMQKVVSNFISGIILLLDKSIKPGDVIAVGSSSGGEKDIFGWVRALGARYASIITRDGKEHLIPNELLISDHVENWSHSNDKIRLKIPVTVSYESDVERALEILVDAANARPRVLNKDKTASRVLALGDHGVNLELRVWISDPVNGVVNIRSFILRDILKRFKEENIIIPYERQELIVHDISPEVLTKLAKLSSETAKTTKKKVKQT